MTSKVYRSAQGKMVDLGTIMLQNEHVRAVGNMGVNARGDKIDNTNQVVETKSQQIQRQNNATTNSVSSSPVHTSSKKNRKQAVDPQTQINTSNNTGVPDLVLPVDPTPVAPQEDPTPVAPAQGLTPPPVDIPAPMVDTAPAPVATLSTATPTKPAGGLAGAIARSREIKQELERTRRQQAQDKGIRKI
jgi:hypothetical protein